MHETVSEWLRDVLSGHSEEQIRDVLIGWQRYFERCRVPESEQRHEFDSIMRQRVANGSISVIAYDADAILGGPRGED